MLKKVLEFQNGAIPNDGRHSEYSSIKVGLKQKFSESLNSFSFGYALSLFWFEKSLLTVTVLDTQQHKVKRWNFQMSQRLNLGIAALPPVAKLLSFTMQK